PGATRHAPRISAPETKKLAPKCLDFKRYSRRGLSDRSEAGPIASMSEPKSAEKNADKPAESEGSSSVPLLRKPGVAVEIGGPKGPEPTRYGDWEQNGRCTDF